MDVVFTVNRRGLEGLGATLTSLVRNCADSGALTLSFLCSGLTPADKTNISQLLRREQFAGGIAYADFNAKQLFGHLAALHGDWTTYGRLLIADLIAGDTALYLDADLVVMLDVLSLADFDFQGHALAAVTRSTVAHALENAFFTSQLQWPAGRPYFNAGVLLFNLKAWRQAGMAARWQALAATHGQQLVSHDQTLLNAVCGGNFARLPGRFNNPWYPGAGSPESAPDAGRSIVHFVGSPKPWDTLGRLVHQGYRTWRSYTTRAWQTAYGKVSKDKLIRTWKIRRSLARHFKNLVYSR